MRVPLLTIALTLALCPACGGDISSTDETGSTGGSGADAQPPQGCSATKPTTLVALPEGFSIDATEVSRCQYQAWLDTAPSAQGQDSWCEWNTEFTPVCEWPPVAGVEALPVVCVDWCDAFAYCRANGKRLCGKIGGGSNVMEDLDDPSKSQWYAACSSGGKYAYPYGDEYDQGMSCNDADKDLEHRLYPVGDLDLCQSSVSTYKGVLDLSGNVWEWEDSCASALDDADWCGIRGGSSFSPEGFASCAKKMGAARRDSGGGVVGFRCCSE